MADLKQYGVLVVGLLMAGGFAFGGMASYSTMIDTQSSNDNEIDAELPSDNFREGAYDLSVNERMYLSLQEDVVFVSAIYNTTEQKEQLMDLQGLEENFDGRVYMSVVSQDESEVSRTYSITEMPSVLLFGYTTSARENPSPGIVRGDLTEENVASTICSSMNEWTGVESYCSRA